ncbi:MAG: lysylphosphatidylglycerol synthase transmembrane domain-containing protein [Rubricoccaceae bacterium]
MARRLKTILALGGSLVLAGGLLYLSLRGVDAQAVREALGAAEWGWLAPLGAVSLLSVAARAWRWQLMLDALAAPRPASRGGERQAVRFGVVNASVLVGYLVNLAAPRLGEIARASTVAARCRLPLAGVLGTVVAERVLDVLTLGVALVSVALLYSERLAALAVAFAPQVAALGQHLPLAAALGGGGLAVAAAAWAWWRRRARRAAAPAETPRLAGRFASLAATFRDGLAALVRIRRRGALFASTATIWGCYALMAWLPLRLLGLTERFGLGLTDAWALMNVGAIGMALPSPGGAGSYHYATVQAFGLLFGVPESPAATYALLAHAAQLVFYAAGGALAMLWLGTSLGALRREAAAPEAAAPEAAPPSLPAPSA